MVGQDHVGETLRHSFSIVLIKTYPKQPSTCIWSAGGFKFLHSGERFRIPLLSVWTEPATVEIFLHIEIPSASCGRGLSHYLLNITSDFYLTFHDALVSLACRVYFINGSFEIIKQVRPISRTQIDLLPVSRVRSTSSLSTLRFLFAR